MASPGLRVRLIRFNSDRIFAVSHELLQIFSRQMQRPLGTLNPPFDDAARASVVDGNHVRVV